MATIASLNVMLTASASGFNAAMSSAERSLGSLKKSASSAFSSINRVGGAALAGGALLAAGAITALAHSQAQAIDATAKLSDALGISTEKLAGLQFAGDLAGVSSDKLAGGLGKLVRLIGDAANGSKAAQEAFNVLGLDFEQLATMDSGDAFAAVAEALKGVENVSQRAALAQNIFGKSAADLVPLLIQGKAGLDEAQAAAERLGITFSRLDAAKVEAANDSFTVLGAAVKGLGQTLAIEVAPFITKAATDFAAWMTEGGRGAQFLRDAVGWVVEAIAFVSDTVDVARIGWKAFSAAGQVALGVLLTPLAEIGKALAWVAEKLGVSTDAAGSKWAFDLVEGLKQTRDSLIAEGADAKAEIQKILDAPATSDKVRKWFEDAKAEADKYAASIAEAAKKQAELSTAISDLGEPAVAPKESPLSEKVSQLRDEVESLDFSFGVNDQRAGIIDANSAQAQLFKFQGGSDSIPAKQLSEAEKQTQTLDDIKEAARDWSRQFIMEEI